MPKPRVATKVLDMRGSYKDNPGRKKDREFEPTDFLPCQPDPPDHLLVAEKKIWVEYMGYIPPGILAGMDMLTFETMIILYTQFRDRKKRDKMSSADIGLMLRCASNLGFTPTDRSKVIQQKPPAGKTGWDGA